MSTDHDINRIKAIADRIKDLRIEAGYSSYEQFAHKHDIQAKQYWRLESGHNFTISSLLRILDIHKLTLEEFFRGLN